MMRDAILLRYSLVPYIYTAAHNAYETGISIVHPMYYDDPEGPEAYEFSGEIPLRERHDCRPRRSPRGFLKSSR